MAATSRCSSLKVGEMNVGHGALAAAGLLLGVWLQVLAGLFGAFSQQDLPVSLCLPE